MQEKEKPEPEIASVIGGWFDGSYMAAVYYKGEVFGIKEESELQLMGSIKIAVDKRNEGDDLRRSPTDD